ncbi:hypothetical protein EV359DRAFT_81484 [Lentinula novae-zelandiae]|nr:hypothetical protein EV359DRAFT_81484 [Lentinula novae-zelandiae]
MVTWRDTPRNEVWSSYRSFFQSRGYALWVVKGYNLKPPNNNPRTPDGFSYENEHSANGPHGYGAGSPLHFPARTADSRDVFIVLLSDGIIGDNCVDTLRSIATGVNAAIDRNHALPMLQEIHCDNLVFGVFPLVGSYFAPAWFSNIAQVLEAMSQVMEGVAFLHDHLVAHRDLFPSNFLSSRRNGLWIPGKSQDFLRPRYYIIDFEWAVRFSPDSDPATRTVTGPPLSWDIYRRPPPPEMLSELPYCPFKADVWQVGKSFIRIVEHIENQIPEILEILRKMSTDRAEDRSSAREAVSQLNEVIARLPPQILQSPIEQVDDYSMDEGDSLEEE